MNTAETKIKEYIEWANGYIRREYPFLINHEGKVGMEIILYVAQMLQREEHFNSLNNK